MLPMLLTCDYGYQLLTQPKALCIQYFFNWLRAFVVVYKYIVEMCMKMIDNIYVFSQSWMIVPISNIIIILIMCKSTVKSLLLF